MTKLKFLVIALLALALTACGNMDMFDTVYTFDKAIIGLPGGSVVEGEVESWTDYEDGDQIQVTIGGVVYLTHASNVILIQE